MTMNDVQSQLLEDPIPVDVADMPEERGARIPLMQPALGVLFQLPDFYDIRPFQSDKGQRISVIFGDKAALKTYPHGAPLRTLINNMEREKTITVDGVKKVVNVSAMAYLLKALGYKGPLRHNKDYASALQQYAGDYFQADLEWSAHCSDSRDVYIEGRGRVQDRKGCNQRWALRGRSYENRDGKQVTILPIPRDKDGAYQESIKCACGATVFVNADLLNFQPKPVAEDGQQQ